MLKQLIKGLIIFSALFWAILFCFISANLFMDLSGSRLGLSNALVLTHVNHFLVLAIVFISSAVMQFVSFVFLVLNHKFATVASLVGNIVFLAASVYVAYLFKNELFCLIILSCSLIQIILSAMLIRFRLKAK